MKSYSLVYAGSAEVVNQPATTLPVEETEDPGSGFVLVQDGEVVKVYKVNTVKRRRIKAERYTSCKGP